MKTNLLIIIGVLLLGLFCYISYNMFASIELIEDKNVKDTFISLVYLVNIFGLIKSLPSL